MHIDDIAGNVGLRQMLKALPDLEFKAKGGKPLVQLCTAGADYGWRELERTASPALLADLSARAKTSLRRNLRWDLEQITRPCFDLEWKSFGLALTAIGLSPGKPDSNLIEKGFLRDKPSHRLFSLFRQFPVLASLWLLVIRQWRSHTTEVLARFAADRRALSRTFFGAPIRRIVNVHFGLSDRHQAGRTVVRLQFDTGSIIYKPRSGTGESEWLSLTEWMNRKSFKPKLWAARVLPRKGYCWMEHVEAAPCKSEAAARRFYERMGGIIAAAHLLQSVDCHRDNLIASGEHPVLVDVDALWHVSAGIETRSLSAVLYRTGFFPNANPRSLQSRSSALGPGRSGNHLPTSSGEPLVAAAYQDEIARGFARAWRCLLGTATRRDALGRRLRRIRSKERRWIYWPTEQYAAIRKASIQPEILRTEAERDLLIRRLCARETASSDVIEAEAGALKRLDIPYFLRQTQHLLPAKRPSEPKLLVKAIREALPKSRPGVFS